MTNAFKRYHDAAARMDSLIDMTPTPSDSSIDAVQARAEVRMGRLTRFLESIGSPHLGRPIVHIGGTSGKGSTSTIIAAILTAAGYKTGLHVSPYLQTPAEKLQVDGLLVSASDYVNLVDEFFAAHDRWLGDGHPALTYGEGFNALMWMFFRQQNVDIGVVEVGAGGRFDLTNILQPSLCVITSVGIDHTATLGNTIPQIAWHKAGIIKPGVPTISGVSDPAAQRVIEQEASTVGAPLRQLHWDDIVQEIELGIHGTSWRDAQTDTVHHMRMAGRFQAKNGQLAVEAMRTFRSCGFDVSDAAIAKGLMTAHIPGRAERIDDRVPVLLDGAHNAEKVAAFASDIPRLLADVNGRKIAVAGLLDSKAGDAMIRSLVPAIDVLIATSPQVTGKEAKDATVIEGYARGAGFRGPVLLHPDPNDALDAAMSMAESNHDAIIVTGSLYLVGNVRGRWYPEEDIVRTRSSWVEN